MAAPAEADTPARPLVGCGRAWGQERIRIVHLETGQPCAAGTVGEIWIAGPHIACGYWRRPEETAAAFGATLPGLDEGPFLRTGDLGFLDGEELFITGRCKDLIIIAGRNHYPTDLEQTAESSHAALRAASSAAFSISDEGEERLVIVAEIERSARTRVDLREVQTAIRRAISQEHNLQTEAIVLTLPASIPKTTSGKIRRSACRQSYLEGTLPVLADAVSL